MNTTKAGENFISSRFKERPIVGGKESDQNELALSGKAHKMLSGKYVQYQEIGIGHYIIMIVPQKAWKNV